MPQFDVFLSHNSVDKSWVIQLKDDLSRYGVSVWLDKDEIRPGDIFAEALENGLANSKAVALIISPDALKSGWVKAEYYRALSLSQNNQTALQLIPVILREAELPGFLQDRSWVDFREKSTYDEKVWELVWGITGKKPPQILELSTLKAPVTRAVPSTNSNFPLESHYGTMSPHSPYYIERPADQEGWNFLNQDRATTIYVQAPRQMGKSSLLRHLTYRSKQEKGLATAFIDFEKFTEQQLANEEKFLIEFCYMIGDALKIPDEIDRYWASRRRSNIVKCSNYVSQYIVPTFGQPFILTLDEVERVLTRPIQNDFFGMLRTWHNDRAWDENFARMTLLLSSSTEPYLFIDNPNQSPFNVARLLFLRDFTLDEVEELNQRYQSPLTEVEVSELMMLLGGHPFLTHLAIFEIATGSYNFESLKNNATSDTGPFGDHLNRYWQQILSMPEIKEHLARICRGQQHPEDKYYYRLKGAGLVTKEGSEIALRNRLYSSYFSERLNV